MTLARSKLAAKDEFKAMSNIINHFVTKQYFRYSATKYKFTYFYLFNVITSVMKFKCVFKLKAVILN